MPRARRRLARARAPRPGVHRLGTPPLNPLPPTVNAPLLNVAAPDVALDVLYLRAASPEYRLR